MSMSRHTIRVALWFVHSYKRPKLCGAVRNIQRANQRYDES